MENNKPGSIDLTDILSRPVVQAQAQPHFDLDTDSHIEDAVFEESSEVQQEPEAAQQQQRAQSAAIPGESLSPDDIAILVVSWVDMLQQAGFTAAKRKLTFTKQELELLPNIDPDKKTVYAPGTKEYIAQAKFRHYLKTIQKLPFTANEKRQLEEATSIYARTVDLKVSPFTGLILAFGGVLGIRGYNVFIGGVE